MPYAQVIEHFFINLWQGNSKEELSRTFTKKAVFKSTEGKHHGLEEIKQYFSDWKIAFPDFSVQVKESFLSANVMTVTWEASGTQAGPFRRYIPTNKKIQLQGTHIFSFENQLITKIEMYADMAPLLHAINHVSYKVYDESDFINRFEGPCKKVYDVLLHGLEPPKSVSQAMTDAMRQFFLQYPFSSLPPDYETLMRDVQVKEITIPSEGEDLKALYYQPKNQLNKKAPVMLYCHGGGWVAIDPKGYDLPNRKLALMANINIICVDYRLAPEHPAPAALDDCCTAYHWIKKYGESIGCDSKKIAVGGDSAGGSLSGGLVMRLQDEKVELPNAVFMASPVIDLELEKYVTYNEKTFNNIIINAALIAFQRAVYVQQDKWTHPYYSPINGDLKSFPPTFILGGQLDPLSEQNEAFANKLKSNGREVDIQLFPDVDHDFHIMGMGLIPEVAHEGFAKVSDFLNQVMFNI